MIDDLDNDGDRDICFYGGYGIFWVRNEGGMFSPWSVISDNSVDGVVVDLDGDADLDVLTGASNEDGLIFWSQNVDGQGTFEEVQTKSNHVARFRLAASESIDTGDGPEFIVSEGGNVYRGRLSGEEFLFTEVFALDRRLVHLSLIDFDSDGDLDIAAATSEAFFWAENRGGQKGFEETAELVPLGRALARKSHREKTLGVANS